MNLKLKAILSGVAILIIAAIIFRISSAFVEAAKVPELEAEIQELRNEKETILANFKQAQEITQTVSQDYENQIAIRDADIARLSSRPAKCLPISTTKAASGSNAANGADQPDKSNGIPDTALYRYAGECETDRIKVNALQSFIDKTWATFYGH